MEVHTPHEPVTSLRGLATHLGLVILGVLIALSFEGIATWREHRALVRDARANLMNEVRDNRNELAERLKEIPQETEQLGRALDVSIALRQQKTIDGQMGLGFKSADLQTASHATAEVTGAFALMEYDEVKMYASLYTHQDVFVKTQDQAKQDLTRALSGVSFLSRNEPASARELEDWSTAIRQALASLYIEGELGASLLKHYNSVLQGRER
jgi:hypothetical protein